MKNLKKSISWIATALPFWLSQGISASEVQIQGIGDANRVPGQYIVILKEKGDGLDQTRSGWVRQFVEEQAERMGTRSGNLVVHLYHGVIQGFAMQASEDEIKEIAKDPDVAYVEADRIVTLNESQENAPWGLDRIDSRSGLDRIYEYTKTGAGVHAYIIDTGLRGTHREFEGRVGEGYSSISDGRGTEDCNGHGTHVTGTIGGSTFGVAKEVVVHPVRVFGCSGSTTNAAILAGVDWVARNAIKPAVANMSLGGGRSDALDNAVQKMIDSGVITVVAAGNSNDDACDYSPAALPAAITVGSSASNDRRSSFSNYGRCVDIFAPGSDIASAWSNSDTASRSISGTSMASPHVAGAVALLLEDSPKITQANVEKTLLERATQGSLSSPGRGSPNLLLFTGDSETDPNPDPEPEPEPDPTNPCGADCQMIEGSIGAGEELILPEGGSFQTSGSIVGYLQGPAGSDLNLYLQRWNWFFGWQNAAASISNGPNEKIEFEGTQQYYRWLIVAESGSGSFRFFTP